MDTGQVAAAITDRTRCLLPVHLYGQCVDMAPLRDLAAEHGLRDPGGLRPGARRPPPRRLAGSMGHAAAFSFYPTKVLGAYGDGGATITPTRVDADLRRLRYYGMEERYYVVETPGHNSRLDEVQAEILRRKLRRLDEYVAGRRAVAAALRGGARGHRARAAPVRRATTTSTTSTWSATPARRHHRGAQDLRHPLNISYPWPVHTMTASPISATPGFAAGHRGVGRGDLLAADVPVAVAERRTR